MIGKLAILLVLAASSTAYAQRSPDTATLDRGDGITRLGLDFGLSFLDDEVTPYSSALRIEPYGQYVMRSGLGFYGALPLARSFGGEGDMPPDEAENTTAVGNLDLGLLYVVDSSPRSSIVFRGGLALPLASDDRAGALTNQFATFPRLTDLALAAPDAWYVRLGVSPLLHGQKLFLRADVGIDIGIDDGDGDDADELLRLNVGGGIDLGVVALSLELVNTATFDDFGNDEDWIHALTGTLRFMGKSFQPVIAVGAPLDDSRRDAVKLYLALGIQVVFK
jgi:hypothetical protein